jgi:hypothetical protein
MRRHEFIAGLGLSFSHAPADLCRAERRGGRAAIKGSSRISKAA